MISNIPTVLIVEDEVDLAKMFAHWIEETCDVRMAHTGADAIEQFDEDIDIVLLDRKLPDLDAEELIDELRRSITRRELETDCLIALITSQSPTEDVGEIPHDAYLKKPVREDELVDLLEVLETESVRMASLGGGVVLKRHTRGLAADDGE